MAVITTTIMCLLYIVPGNSQLITEEWVIVGAWILLGIAFYGYARKQYKEKFGTRQKLIYEDVVEEKPKKVRERVAAKA